MKRTCLRAMIALFACISSYAFPQTETPVMVRDLEVWSGIGVYKNFLDKKLELNLEEQFRFHRDASRIDQFFTNFGATYSFNKYFSLGAGYRFISDNDDTEYQSKHRFNFDAKFKYKINRVTLGYRFRYQNGNNFNETIEEDQDYPRKAIRNKLSIKYNIKDVKINPYFSTELFRAYEKYTIPEWDKLRFTLGGTRKLKNFGKVNAFYRMEKELNESYPVTYNIIGVKLQYNLNNLINKKKDAQD